MKTTNQLPSSGIRRSLKELWLHVIYRCNLACTHCLFACSPQADPNDISFEDSIQYVTEAMAQGVENIYITGGEPFLWPHMTRFLKWYYSLDQVLPLTILTNGILIDQGQAEFLKQFTARGLTLRISLECYTSDTHEKFRGAGSFQLTLKSIKNLNQAGIKPWIAYVNKSGGSIDCLAVKSLEEDFVKRLGNDYGLEIAGLKVIAAYAKGRFKDKVNFCDNFQDIEKKLETVQCYYGVAVSNDGIFPCPILVDVIEARATHTLHDAVGRSFSLEYNCCTSCFATGTTCGQ